jgi:hypothetical protein
VASAYFDLVLAEILATFLAIMQNSTQTQIPTLAHAYKWHPRSQMASSFTNGILVHKLHPRSQMAPSFTNGILVHKWHPRSQMVPA